jgi:ribosomal protein L37AE/L43A
MSGGKGQVYEQVKAAGLKVLGTKFCFSCQRHRSLETGKQIQRKGSTVWRCGECALRMNKMGFKKGAANG